MGAVDALLATLGGVAENPGLSWLVADHPAGASVKLVCFPHAGGDPRGLLRWASALPGGVDVVVCSPDEADPAEGFDVLGLAREAADRLARAAGQALCLYGHSFGAIVAYETARALPVGAGPAQLVVSGMEAPHLRVDPGYATLPDAELLAVLHGYGGTPSAVLSDADFAVAYLARIRADLARLADYRFAPGPPLRCPISVVAGRSDPSLRPDAVQAWRELTVADTEIRFVSGGHFFVRDQDDFARLVAEPLLRAAHDPPAR